MKNVMYFSTAILLVLLKGKACYGFPVLESEDMKTGNRLTDEFLHESSSTSLVDPIVMEDIPGLSSHLQPPSSEFPALLKDTPQGSLSKSDLIKQQPKKPVLTMSSVSQPRRYMEPPTRDFLSNPKKAVSEFLWKTSKTSSPDLDKRQPLEPLRHGSSIPQIFSSLFAQLPTSFIRASPRSLQTASSDARMKDQKKSSTKTTLKEGKDTKRTKTELVKRKEVKVATGMPKLQVPGETLLPPVKDFDFQISEVLVPPAREFIGDGSS